MAVNLFWTGGWDSTYRLLQIVFDLQEYVQPIYVVDESRHSTRMELKTIAAVKQAVRSHNGGAGARILPTRITSRCDIPENPSITEAFTRMRQMVHLGDQYEWLARYADAFESEPVEISIHAGGELGELLQRSVEHDGDGYLAIRQDTNDIYTVFRYYRFPILGVPKTEMRRDVKEKGRTHIQELAWFCHMPTRNETPCGSCSACRQVLKGGMGYRIPLPQRVKGQIRLATVHSRYGSAAKESLKRLARQLRK